MTKLTRQMERAKTRRVLGCVRIHIFVLQQALPHLRHVTVLHSLREAHDARRHPRCTRCPDARFKTKGVAGGALSCWRPQGPRV